MLRVPDCGCSNKPPANWNGSSKNLSLAFRAILLFLPYLSARQRTVCSSISSYQSSLTAWQSLVRLKFFRAAFFLLLKSSIRFFRLLFYRQDDTLPLTATKCPLAVAVNDFYEHIISHLVKTLAWFQLLIPELTVSLSLTGFSLAGGNLNFAPRPSKGNWNESPQWPGWTFLVLCCGPWPRSSNVFLICHRSDNDQILITHPWLLFFTVVVLQKNYG